MFRLVDRLARTVVAVLLMSSLAAGQERYDVVIQGGRVVDGTGSPWYAADIGISGGKIVKVGRIAADSATRTIDAQGMIVAPGFVDMMGQTATPMLRSPRSAINLLTQGITTINAGEGASAAPLSEQQAARAGWSTMAEYFQLLDLKGLPLNVVQTVGHTQVRRIVLGDVDRSPSAEEMERMKALVREAMEAGAIGVSTALIYPPAVYADKEEIAELVKVAGEYGGRYYTHMRNEGDQLLEAIDEALDIGRIGEAPVHIFHLKAAGRRNWGKMQLAIARIKAVRSEGRQVTADVYPYINNGLGVAAFIHPRHFAQGREHFLKELNDAKMQEIRQEMETTSGWENWFRHVGNDWDKVIIGQATAERYKAFVGQSVAQIATAVGEDSWDTFFNLVRTGAFALPQSMTEANKILAMQQEFVSFCTDVGPAGGSRIASHPRAFGSFPRLLARYVRDLGAITLERAVAQASAAALNDVLVYDRGRIAEGLAADLVIFDLDQIADRATFALPAETSVGVHYVLVNGTVVLENGRFTGKRPGRVLRGPGYDHSTRPAATKTGNAPEPLRHFDAMIESFLERHRVPGAAFAVTWDGRLVYARGFGYADVAERKKVDPTSLFRIASISKPITAGAILQLVESGKIKLDSSVFEVLGVDSEDQSDPRQRQITVRHLLEHRGGWDRRLSFDAMFQSVRFAREQNVDPPAGFPEIIRSMNKQKLDFDPGERYSYSNYGYCLLGRLIEKVTGESYEAYVKQNLLAPLDIRSMRIGKTLRHQRVAGEVAYYDPGQSASVFAANLGETVPNAYGAWYLEAMDSHGAWIASAVELARFACGLATPGKILSAESLELLDRRPPGAAGHDENGNPKSEFYSLGWSNREWEPGKTNRWHTGSLPGTATILIRRHDGCNLIALFNTRVSPRASHLGREIDQELNDAADQVRRWPDEDLFGLYAPDSTGGR